MHPIQLRPAPHRGAVARSGGFTLLEIVIVLVIITLVVSVGAMSFDSVMREQELRRPVLEFKNLTAEAVRRATLYERPQMLIFDKTGVTMPLRMPRPGDDTPVTTRRVTLPPTMTLTLRRFGADVFAPAAGQRLMVSPSGLCEPLTARFQQGTAWFEVTLDPLTGAAKEERMIIE